ncbi:PH domain-containing protein [Priestia megaterium]|uniref:PH domain-containing protein n=1 Tax=Priestia megaterium TaxID=1404 RepID=UPI002E1ABBA8|nr:PH domain-containing protein [Priestia megaterium]
MSKTLEQLENECREAYTKYTDINKYERTYNDVKKALKTISVDIDEKIIFCTEFIAGTASIGLFILTNRQCIVTKPKFARIEVEYYPFDKLKTVKYKKTLIWSLVQIYVDADKDIEFTHSKCDKIVNIINDAINNYKYPKKELNEKNSKVENLDLASNPDPISELERLGNLLEKKLITDEEFHLLKCKVIKGL